MSVNSSTNGDGCTVGGGGVPVIIRGSITGTDAVFKGDCASNATLGCGYGTCVRPNVSTVPPAPGIIAPALEFVPDPYKDAAELTPD